MDFNELASKRCSVRSFDTGRAIPDDILRRVLEAGRMAPSAKNLQPWKFHVVRSPRMLAKLYACYPGEWLKSAPCLLAVSGRRSGAWVRRKDGYNSLETDLTIVMDHLILAATAHGLGSCWVAAFDPEMLHEALQLGPEDEIFALTPLGYAAADAVTAPKNRKPLDEITEFL
ncbi:MAG: nitroreductase [Chlorobiaceae bacterium]|nr:nitroreductase [Chlorobiaceae bacterium]NTW11136.1 nitroreductase [Chlorobiaceae bacterium]